MHDLHFTIQVKRTDSLLAVVLEAFQDADRPLKV